MVKMVTAISYTEAIGVIVLTLLIDHIAHITREQVVQQLLHTQLRQPHRPQLNLPPIVLLINNLKLMKQHPLNLN